MHVGVDEVVDEKAQVMTAGRLRTVTLYKLGEVNRQTVAVLDVDVVTEVGKAISIRETRHDGRPTLDSK